MSGSAHNLVVVGNGMVGHRFLDLLAADPARRADTRVTLFCEEPRLAYDRVNLSGLFSGKTADDLALASPEVYQAAGFTVHRDDRVATIDRNRRIVRSDRGLEVPFDALVLATGSRPFVPPVPGADAPGTFVYRTIEDLEKIRQHAESSRRGIVVGGGLLGLEAANALRSLGVETHVVDIAPRLMALQLDEAGGSVLRECIEDLGVIVHTGLTTSEVIVENGQAAGLRFKDGVELRADMVVFSAGIRARDELARSAGLAVGERGGVVIDKCCRTSDPGILAIGECANFSGRTYGLVAPGYRMAEVALATLSGGDAVLGTFNLNTKLKLLGVDVASFGDAFATTPGARTVSFMDAVKLVYKKLVLSADRKTLLGGILVGDASAYATLVALLGREVPGDIASVVAPQSPGGKPAGLGVDALPDTALVCSCHNVSKQQICQAITDGKLTAVGQVKGCTRAGTGCGSCVTLVTDLLKTEMKRAGLTVNNHLCAHFAHSRQELFHLIRVHGLRTFDDVLAHHGKGLGCEICKPAVASILASTWNDHILEARHVGLQDTNDRFMANLQRDGTYSVVPRVPGGEITPDQLIALGHVAKTYRLYSKITGGQRVDLFGARIEQLPAIWRELIAAGFESGHAYGKALRTVKSCVGSTWCRYGVQDSVGLAIRLEHRYKGLRAPHKIKSAVSGCARECAEAQSKDFGVIATDKGYNLYVCGNGGMKPQHAHLLATDLDEATLVRYVDRFLMFYIRTGDRLERTATWLNKLEGGIDYLRAVVVDDSLGIAAELENDLQALVDSYQCEWTAALRDPDKLKMFRSFINTPETDASIVFVPERSQHRPARPDEKMHLHVLREALS